MRAVGFGVQERGRGVRTVLGSCPGTAKRPPGWEARGAPGFGGQRQPQEGLGGGAGSGGEIGENWGGTHALGGAGGTRTGAEGAGGASAKGGPWGHPGIEGVQEGGAGELRGRDRG